MNGKTTARRHITGAMSKVKGDNFEARINESFFHYQFTGEAMIEKTPEPMRPIKSIGQGRFVACYTKQAQPDYKGIIKGGKMVVFEAKYTSTDRLEQSRVIQNQAEYMDMYLALGASCYILAGFGTGNAYCIPWILWKNMKPYYGRKYVKEEDISQYKIEYKSGLLMILSRVI